MNQITSPKKLLIVEDDFYILDLYKIEAKDKGFEVYAVADGEEALTMTKNIHPDVILLDLMLPKINGVDVLKTIKSWEDFRNIPIVVFTNVSDDETKKEVLSLGAVEFLLKIEHSPTEIIDILSKY